MPVPDRKTCFKLLRKYHVPPHIIGHSLMVARVAVSIGCMLNERKGIQTMKEIDVSLAQAAGMLHDIAKLECIHNYCEHALRGAEILVDSGYPEIADVVRQHVILDRPVSAYSHVNEAMVLNYADKRVMHTRFVSLERRFDDLFRRYGTTHERQKKIEFMYQEARVIEEMIFRAAGTVPEALRPESLREPLCTGMHG